jgi:DNA modification methylase
MANHLQRAPNFPPYKVARVADLIPYARNSRTHSDEQVAQIAASIREFGFTNPVLVDGERGIIAGHGRVLAARKLGLDEVPVIELAHLTEAQRRAYVIADNKLALNAGWDMDLLKVELGGLQADGFDLGLTGFSGDELAGLFAESTEGLTDPDEAPEVPAEPVSVLGDVWLLGRHRIVCGDCTDPLVVDKALNGVKPHLMVTDPPYGVNYDPTRTSKNAKKAGVVLNDDRADWSDAWALFPGDVAYVWHASMFTTTVLQSLEQNGFEHRSMIIWVKDRFTLGRGHYHWRHEPAWYVVKKGANGHWKGARDQDTVWNIKAREDAGHGHGTQKPVECMKRPIENNSSPGQAVYEPFSGSGTTIIAAEMTGRSCHAIELNPAYVDVAVKRWQDFTGQQATLEADGRAFDVMAASRNGP